MDCNLVIEKGKFSHYCSWNKQIYDDYSSCINNCIIQSHFFNNEKISNVNLSQYDIFIISMIAYIIISVSIIIIASKS